MTNLYSFNIEREKKSGKSKKKINLLKKPRKNAKMLKNLSKVLKNT